MNNLRLTALEQTGKLPPGKDKSEDVTGCIQRVCQQPRWLLEVFAPTQALGLMPRRRRWQDADSEEQGQDSNPVLSNLTPLPLPSSSHGALGDPSLRELDGSLGVSMATSDSTPSGRMVYLNPTALSGRSFVSLASKVRSLSMPRGSAVAANSSGQQDSIGLKAI